MYVFRWILVATTALVASSVHSTCPVCLSFRDVSSIESALLGFDPFMDDNSKDPNPGVKGQVFQPYTQLSDGRLEISRFITKALDKHHCTPKFEARLLKNYNQYKDSRSLITSIGEDTQVYEAAYQARGQETTDEEDNKVKTFFQETNGEIISVTYKCITNVIEVASFISPTFTHSFAAAIRSLHNAAKNPNSAESTETYVNFVKSFGINYMTKVSLGTKITFEKIFTRKSTNPAEETERKLCARRAARASFTEGFTDIVAAEDSFSTKSQSCSPDTTECPPNYLVRSGLRSEKVTSLGSMHSADSESRALNRPSSVPVAFELRTMSSLFRKLRFNVGAVNQEGLHEEFNGTATSDFFDGMTSNYCTLILRRNCTVSTRKGCGLNSLCAVNERCIHDASGHLGYRCIESTSAEPVSTAPPPNLVNGALHKPVTASASNPARLRIHGLYSTPGQVTNGDVSNFNNFYHSDLLEQPFLVVDLGRVMPIWGVRIMPGRFSYLPERFRDISVRTGNHAAPGPKFNSYSEIFFYAGPHGNPPTWIEHTLSTPLCGRYVSMQRTKSGKSYLEVLELEVLVEM